MVVQMRRAQERFSDAVAAVNREAALADVSVQAELLKLAVSTAADLKRGLASIMAQYFNTVAGVQDRVSETNTERAKIVADAETKFITALTAYESVNQSYYKALADVSLDQGRIGAAVYSAAVTGAGEKAKASVAAAQLRVESSRMALEAAVANNRSAMDRVKLEADNYAVKSSAYDSQTRATIEAYKGELAGYTAGADVEIAKAKVGAGAGAGTAVAGIAKAYGDIAAAAANASGSLVAQLEAL
jgi:hypothetical protein